MKLSKQEIEHLASLSRLELTKEEKDKFSQQIGEVLSYVSKVQNWIEKDKKEPDLKPENSKEINQLREDEKVACEILPEELLKNVPEVEDNFVKVPSILEEL